jgi:hypothetical protein
MNYHYGSGKWKLVDKTPAQIAAAKKTATERAAKFASAALLVESAEGEQQFLILRFHFPLQDQVKTS